MTLDHAVSVFSGLIPIALTPFRDDETLDREGFARSLAGQVRAGVDGVMVPAFASEFHKLTGDERHELADIALEQLRRHEAVRVIVSVPDHATVSAVAEVEWACAAGADGINVLPPFFLGPSRSAQVEHLATILSTAGDVPVMVQYAPQLTGAAFALDDIGELRVRYPNLQAVKIESLPPGPEISRVLAMAPGMNALVGYAGLHMIDALRRGAHGVQPANAFPEIYRRILDEWNAGRRDAAEALHTRLLPYISYWMQGLELAVAAEKRIGELRGWFSTSTCRRPGRVLDEHELRTIDRFMTEFDDLL